MLSVPTRMDVCVECAHKGGCVECAHKGGCVECAHKVECVHQCCVTVQFYIPLKMFEYSLKIVLCRICSLVFIQKQRLGVYEELTC